MKLRAQVLVSDSADADRYHQETFVRSVNVNIFVKKVSFATCGFRFTSSVPLQKSLHKHDLSSAQTLTG